jgi:hypothetical protein
MVEEETSSDSEQGHTTEVVGYVALTSGFLTNDAGEIIGEADWLSADNDGNDGWHTVYLGGDYIDPVVFMNLSSYNGVDPSHIRIRNVTSASFDFKIEEWAYLNGSHVTEDLDFLVIERGVHLLADGRLIEVGWVEDANHVWRYVPLSGEFFDIPVVLSQSQTYNGPDPVVTRQRSVGTVGFEVRLQQEEGRDGSHLFERTGFIAVEPDR